MFTGTRSTILNAAIGIVLLTGSVSAETAETDSLQAVTATSDSILAIVARALIEQDTVLLGSILVEDVGIVMPNQKSLTGRKKVVMYLPLLMETVGGGELIPTRKELIFVRDYSDMVWETGHFTFSRKIEGTEDLELRGGYSIYWGLREGNWVIERVFIGLN